MFNKKIKPKQLPKFRLILDSAFAAPSVFKKLCKKAAVKHIRHTYNFPQQAEDEEIYEFAVKKQMFVVTINFKDFQRLVKKGKPGILALDSGLSNEQMDVALTKFVSGKNPQEYFGKAIRVK